MRIIGGEFRSRRLKTVPGLATRPTSDKLRETLFDVLGPDVTGSVWYDCFAGSGAVGLEALSRAADFAVFVESATAAVRVLQQNVAALGVEQRCLEIQKPVAAALVQAGRPAGFVFLDPPYAAALEYRRVLSLLGEGALLKPHGMVIAEHARRSPLEPAYGRLARYRVLEQGDSALSFYKLVAG
jgi:16S rRNA (guanine966-N2)-methyltransferase